MDNALVRASPATADAGYVTAPPIPIYRAGLGRSVPRSSIRVGPASALPEVLAEFGVAAEPLFRSFGVAGHVFDDPDNTLPFSLFCSLISKCVEATGRDDLGLLVCEKAGASNLGLVGFLLQQAPDVRTALGDLVRYLHHNDRGSVPFLGIANGVASLGYAIHEPDVAAADQIYDGALAVCRNIMLALCGPKWTPVEVVMSRPRPAMPARYEKFFGSPVRFDAEQSAIFFAETWLDLSVPRADPALRRMLQEQVDHLELEEPGNLSEQVRRLLRLALLTSSGSIDHVSRHLKTTKRTLGRRLAVEGTSFKTLSEEVHFDVARHLLVNTGMTMTEISLALNYSEPSAFTRAFRKWSGVTPRAWRGKNARAH